MSSHFPNTSLPAHLRVLKEEIEGYARDFGLDFYETIFEVVDADELNEIAAYGGFPTRYPHWSFGMQYEELKKSYDYGLSKIYEMVINNDPCYAYLMRCNHTVDQKLVMAHVYGHCDFFKNNAYFAHTSRKMMDEMANHGARIKQYAERFGEDEVEAFVDKCMSIDDLIDIHSTAIKRRGDNARYDFALPHGAEEPVKLTRFKAKQYMDEYINPRDALRAEEAEHKKAAEDANRRFPERPEKDVLLFLIEHAPLKTWQRDILEIVRNEAYYFMPQGQTKVANEGWACINAHAYVVTDDGFRRMGEFVTERRAAAVSDGTAERRVYDWAVFNDRKTVRVRTRRGLILEGSTNHRVMLADDSWRQLDQIAAGDHIRLARGADVWAKVPYSINWSPTPRLAHVDIGDRVGVSSWTVLRHLKGRRVRAAAAIDAVMQTAACRVGRSRRCRVVTIPSVVDKRLAAFLGYLIGDGHISDVKRTIGLTTADDAQADHFAQLTSELFGIDPRRTWDRTKWRVRFSARVVQDFLQHLGLKTGPCAREKTVPECVLRSPKPVVAAFLRALYDCDGYAGTAGVILSTSSDAMSEIVQLLLLNFGALSYRKKGKDECWHVTTQGASAAIFQREIGFGLERKQAKLSAYVNDRRWFCRESDADTIVAIERGRADVYDISVEATHRYVAQGFVNHNSYWHSTIMTQKALSPTEVIDYADHHSGTMAMSGGRLNPYKIGIELLRDIEERWNKGRFGKEWDECDDLDKRRTWDLQLGLGRQKIFEVRRVHNDLTFIDTFLTPEFCVRHNLFTYAWQEHQGQYFIESRDFAEVKRRLLFSMTNFGRPWIYVVDGNFRNRGELLLRHRHEGQDLSERETRDTMANLHALWSRPVNLETVAEGKHVLLGFDGTDHTKKPFTGESK